MKRDSIPTDEPQPTSLPLLTGEALQQQVFDITAESSDELRRTLTSTSLVEFDTDQLAVLIHCQQQYATTENVRFKNNLAAIVFSLFYHSMNSPAEVLSFNNLMTQILYRSFTRHYYSIEIFPHVQEILSQTFGLKEFALTTVLDYLKDNSQNFIEFITDIQSSNNILESLKIEQPEDSGFCGGYAAYSNLLPGMFLNEDANMLSQLLTHDHKKASTDSHPLNRLVDFFIGQAAELEQVEEDTSSAQMMKLFSDNHHPFPNLLKAVADFNQVPADTLIPMVINDQKEIEIGHGDPISQLKMITNLVNLFYRSVLEMPIAYSFLVYLNNEHWLSLTWIAHQPKPNINVWLVADSTDNHGIFYQKIKDVIENLLYHTDSLKSQIRIIINQARAEFAFLNKKSGEVSIQILEIDALVRLLHTLAKDKELRFLIKIIDFESVEKMVTETPQFSYLLSDITQIKDSIEGIPLTDFLIHEVFEEKDEKKRDFHLSRLKEITQVSIEKYGIGPAMLKPLAKKTDTSEFKQEITEFFKNELYNKENPVYEFEDKPYFTEMNRLFEYLKEWYTEVGYHCDGVKKIQERLLNSENYPFKKPEDKRIFYKNLKFQIEVILFCFYQQKMKLPIGQRTNQKSLLSLKLAGADTSLTSFLKELNDLPNTTELCADSYGFINDIFYQLNRMDGIDKELAESCELTLLRFSSNLYLSHQDEYGGYAKHIETAVMRVAADYHFPITTLSHADEHLPNFSSIQVNILGWFTSEFFKEFNRETILSLMYDHLRKKFFDAIAEFSALELTRNNVPLLTMRLKPFIDSGFLTLYGEPQDKNAIVWVKDDKLVLNNGLKEDDIGFSSRFFGYVYRQAVSSQRILPILQPSFEDIREMLSINHIYSVAGALLPDQKTTALKHDMDALIHLVLKYPVDTDGSFSPYLYRNKMLLCKILIDFLQHSDYSFSNPNLYNLLSNMCFLVNKRQRPLFNYMIDALLSASKYPQSATDWRYALLPIWNYCLYQEETHCLIKMLTNFPNLYMEKHEEEDDIAIFNWEHHPLSGLLNTIRELRKIKEFKPDFVKRMIKVISQTKTELVGILSPEEFFKILQLQLPEECFKTIFGAYAQTSLEIEELFIIAQYTEIDFSQPRSLDEKESKTMTPLLWALGNHRFDQFQQLLRLGADPTVTVGESSCFMLAVDPSCELEIFNQLVQCLSTRTEIVGDEKLIGQYMLAAAKAGPERLMALLSHIALPMPVLDLPRDGFPEFLSSLLKLIQSLRKENYTLASCCLPGLINLNLLSVILRQCEHRQSQNFLKVLIKAAGNSRDLCELLKFYSQNVESHIYETVDFDLNSLRHQGKPMLLLALEEKNNMTMKQQMNILLRHGAKVGVADNKGMRPLNKSLYLRMPQQLEVLKILFASENKPAAEWFEATPDGKSLLVEAVESKSCSSKSFELILEKFALADLTWRQRNTLLLQASQVAQDRGNDERAKRLKEVLASQKDEKQISKIEHSNFELLDSKVRFPASADFKNSEAIFSFDGDKGSHIAYTIFKRLNKMYASETQETEMINLFGNKLHFTALACKKGYLKKFLELFHYETLAAHNAASYICHRGSSAEDAFVSAVNTRAEQCRNAFQIILADKDPIYCHQEGERTRLSRSSR